MMGTYAGCAELFNEPALSRGDLCLVEIAFTDGSGSKVRPALVLGDQGADVVVAPLTTRRARTEFDVELDAWAKAGLTARGTVRCAKIGSVSRTLVYKVVGHVLPDDWQRISSATSRWFNLLVA